MNKLVYIFFSFFLFFPFTGRYTCIIDRKIPYIQWQDIVIEPLPNIIVGEDKRTFQCVPKTVSLKCCEDKNSVEWTQITSDDKVTSGCTNRQYIQAMYSYKSY